MHAKSIYWMVEMGFMCGDAMDDILMNLRNLLLSECSESGTPLVQEVTGHSRILSAFTDLRPTVKSISV